MAFRDKTFESIMKDMLDRVANTLDKRQGSIIYDALAPAAAELAQAYIDLEFIYSQLDVENLRGEKLERFVHQRTGITRKQATKAIRKGVFSKADGSFLNVEIGSRFTGGDLYFKAIEKIRDGEFKLESEASGNIGNSYAGRLLPVDYISELARAELVDILTYGYDAEDDESLTERYYERIRTPATSGNKYHYLNWAKEVTGVGDARVISLWAGDNTVKVIIIDSNKQPASGELVGKVQNYIDPGITGLGEGQAPIGAFCTVVSATGKAINISVTVTRDENYSLEQIKISIESNVNEYLKNIAFKEDIVSYAKIGSLILESEGVLDYADLKMNEGISNIVVNDEEIAILGEVVISE